MKAVIVQGAAPTSPLVAPQNYDFTDSSAAAPNNDFVGAFFTEGIGANANNISAQHFSFGFCDSFGNNLSLGFSGDDAAAGAAASVSLSNVHCLSMPGASGGFLYPVAAFSSKLATGVRLSATTIGAAARITNCKLLSGTDIEAECGSVQFAAADTSHAITFAHLAGQADVIYLLIAFGQTGTDNAGTGGSIGWYERQGGVSVCQAYGVTSGANPTDLIGYLSSSHIGEILSSSAVLCDVTVDTFSSTGFTIRFSAGTAPACLVGWIAIRGKNQQMITKAGVASLPTAVTSSTKLISGMDIPGPLSVFCMPGRFTAKDAVEHGAPNDQGGAIGMCMAATPDHSASTQASVSSTFQDNVAGSSVGKNKNVFGRFLSTQAFAGTDVIVATVQSWNTDGITPNYTAVDASGIFAPYLGLGMPPPYTAGTFAYSGGVMTFTTGSTGPAGVLLGSGTFDYVGAASASDFEVPLGDGVYGMAVSPLSLTISPVLIALDTGYYALTPQNVDFVTFVPPPPVIQPFPYYPVTGRRMNWDTVVRMAGGITQPHPYEVYRFGGGQIQRSFYENV